MDRLEPLVNPARARIVVGVVEWTWYGHHPLYCENFVRCLLGLGCTVYALCPAPEDLRGRLGDLSEDERSCLHVERLHGWAPAPKALGEEWGPIVAGARTFRQIRKRLRLMERAHGGPVSLVFFCCIYDWHFRNFPRFGWLLPWKWSGLYLQSFGFRKTTSPIYEHARNSARPGDFLEASNCSSIGTLDEGVAGKVEDMVGKGKCVLFPDFTDASLSDFDHSLGSKIQRFAGGRPIVMLCGALYAQRGVNLFLKVAQENPQWCFALVGKLSGSLEGAHAAPFVQFAENLPFAYFHPLPVSDERNYNSAIRCATVVWNIHIDWPGSSNTLTKAAAFGKPVVVGRGHLLEERVREFRLGEVCDENDPASISRGLHAILASPEAWLSGNKPLWDEFGSLHSKKRLSDAMERVVVLANDRNV